MRAVRAMRVISAFTEERVYDSPVRCIGTYIISHYANTGGVCPHAWLRSIYRRFDDYEIVRVGTSAL